MHGLSILCAIWSFTLSFSAMQVEAGTNSAETTEKLQKIVSVLRVLWGRDFDSMYETYIVGASPIITLIPRREMIRLAEARLDGRRRDGAETQGLTVRTESAVKVVVVYDDIDPFLVAATINHEIGHVELHGQGLSRNEEEARVRKIVDTRFFEKVFGKDWLQMTATTLKEKVSPVERNGRVYQGHTPEAVETLYRQFRQEGVIVEKTPLHDRILAIVVFILTNSEENVLAALDAEDFHE
jgi:hypothetical protein